MKGITLLLLGLFLFNKDSIFNVNHLQTILHSSLGSYDIKSSTFNLFGRHLEAKLSDHLEYSHDGQQFDETHSIYLLGSASISNQSTHNTSATDDHGGNTSHSTHSGHPSLYNALTSIDFMIGSVSILIIIASILFVEYFFETLNVLTEDTPFEELLHAIEKELMIVGTMAFIFKIILSLNLVKDDAWIFALEYADTLIPITAFMFCIEGVFLIVMSIKQCELWSKSYNLKFTELLDEYFDANVMTYIRFHWIPFAKNTEVEFKLYHVIFCKLYHIKPNAFLFDEYVQLIFEKFLFRTITIQFIDWVILVCFVLINWGRNEANIQIRCRHPHECSAWSSIQLFTILGLCMLFVTLVIAVLSRVYELRLLAFGGVTKGDDYVTRLRDEASKDEQNENHRLHGKHLKYAIMEAKSNNVIDENIIETFIPWIISTITNFSMREFMRSLFTKKNQYSMADDGPSYYSSRTVSHNTAKKIKSNVDKLRSEIALRKLGVKEMKPGRSSEKQKRRSIKSPKLEAIKSPKGHIHDEGLTHAVQRLYETSTSPTKPVHKMPESQSHTALELPDGDDVLVKLYQSVDEIKQKHESKSNPSSPKFDVNIYNEHPGFRNLQKGHAENINDIFLFQRSGLYFGSITLLMMIISFYLALWLTNFLSSSVNTLQSPLWTIISLLPGVFSFAIYVYIVRCAVILQALIFLDHDVFEEVLEAEEEAEVLARQLRDSVVSQCALIHSKNPDQELFELYRVLYDDDMHSREMTRKMFQLFLDVIGISLSRKRLRQIFRQIDRNFDNVITFDEFVLFIFPEHVRAQAVEQKRLERLQHTVDNKIKKYEEKKQSFIFSAKFSYMNLFSPRTQIHNDNSPSHHGENHLELVKKVKQESFSFLPEETNNGNSDYGNLGSGFFLPDNPDGISTKSENKSEKNPICNDV